ncbi:hypothetical protein SAMD00019534_103180 [Acytostelium subglobosum LB1]|uniref:hypothetical protein n=1 Tax=Acytostelium subglobosum LB1 TaxID=1410327 RepID=UPI000644DAAB|nr:hypothetical protein SAMD00019534_103180 [Acytostelium subglobosum LB1]GAM27143.1 hypothetical protein SAMD00019534_103180 [Acytostelium subglobosum LB1]|eukprot:XP_012750023.1 hypothetical protein SAMD00019534_103180 [Acytostelium subglobosum LB1]
MSVLYEGKPYTIERWTEIMLSANNVTAIIFEEETGGHEFGPAFWDGIKDFMAVIPSDELPDPIFYPLTLTKLVINGEFGPLEGLPDSLTSLTIWSNEWNLPIVPGTLPKGLKRLKFGDGFNQPIADGTFPETLERVNFGFSFNQPLTPANLPVSITRVRLNELYDHQLGSCAQHWRTLRYDAILELMPGLVCQALTNLSTKFADAAQIITANFPTLQTLHIVTSLRIGVNKYIPLDLSTLPASLHELTISTNGYYSAFPQGLDTLEVNGNDPNFRLAPGILPPRLRSLTLNYYHHQFEVDHFPSTLTSLTLGDVKKWPYPNQLPTTLRSLILRINNHNLMRHTPLYLATLTLTRIHLNYTSFSLDLYRIADTLFLRCQGTLFDRLPTCGFISSQKIKSIVP